MVNVYVSCMWQFPLDSFTVSLHNANGRYGLYAKDCEWSLKNTGKFPQDGWAHNALLITQNAVKFQVLPNLYLD